jgi:hypothetical protein
MHILETCGFGDLDYLQFGTEERVPTILHRDLLAPIGIT